MIQVQKRITKTSTNTFLLWIILIRPLLGGISMAKVKTPTKRLPGKEWVKACLYEPFQWMTCHYIWAVWWYFSDRLKDYNLASDKIPFFIFYVFCMVPKWFCVCINSHSVSFWLYFYGFCTYFKVVHLYVARSMASVPHAPPHNKYMQKPQISTSVCHWRQRRRRRRRQRWQPVP